MLITKALKALARKYGPICHRRLLRAVYGAGIAFTQNDRRLAALRDIHRGRRAFLIGMGPSLEIRDLDRLKDEITFSCNKIYLAFDETSWRPSYHTVTDILVAQNNCEVIRALDLGTKVFSRSVRPHFRGAKDVIWLREFTHPISDEGIGFGFSTNVLEGVYGGYTVLFTILQLAFFMGIRLIYLIGVDFHFDVPKSTGRQCLHGEILESSGEVNHFHRGYRTPQETWTMPRLDLQRRAFICAREVVSSHGGRIINASRQTALDVFPRADLDAVLSVGAGAPLVG